MTTNSLQQVLCPRTKLAKTFVRLEGIEPTRCQSRGIYSPPRLLNGLQTHIICNLYYRVVAKHGSINEVISSNDNTCPMRTSTGKGSRTLRTQILSLVPMPIRLYPHSSPGRARTADPRVNSSLLYLLSYRGIFIFLLTLYIYYNKNF